MKSAHRLPKRRLVLGFWNPKITGGGFPGKVVWFSWPVTSLTNTLQHSVGGGEGASEAEKETNFAGSTPVPHFKTALHPTQLDTTPLRYVSR